MLGQPSVLSLLLLETVGGPSQETCSNILQGREGGGTQGILYPLLGIHCRERLWLVLFPFPLRGIAAPFRVGF